MKKVEIYDQYNNVYDVDGTTLLHASSGFTTKIGEYSDSEALNIVENQYNTSKALGVYEDKLIKLDKGYAELVIEFPDKKLLNRVIYTVNV